MNSKSEWLKARKVGGSSAAAILGVSKWLTKNDVFNELVLNRHKNQENERTREGSIAEDYIRKLFILEHPEYEVEEPPKDSYWLFISKTNHYLTLTPDGLLTEKATKRKGGLEIKDVELRRNKDKENWNLGFIPPYYFTQLIHYFIVKDDIEFMILQARLKIYEGKELDHIEERSYLLKRESVKKEIEEQLKCETEFIEKHIIKKERPEFEIII